MDRTDVLKLGGDDIMYILSPIETRLNNIYFLNHVYLPHDLNIRNLSCIFDILLLLNEGPSAAYNIRGIKSIVIDNRLPEYQQNEIFFHEMCHLIFHAGNQHNVNDSFLFFQEGQADTFALYAALPYFMLQQFDLADPNIIEKLSEQFLLSYAFVAKRLQQIHNQILANSS